MVWIGSTVLIGHPGRVDVMTSFFWTFELSVAKVDKREGNFETKIGPIEAFHA